MKGQRDFTRHRLRSQVENPNVRKREIVINNMRQNIDKLFKAKPTKASIGNNLNFQTVNEQLLNLNYTGKSKELMKELGSK